MSEIQWLDRLDPAQVAFGSKARALARLQQRGYPVAPGFVIPAAEFEAALAHLHQTEPSAVDLACSNRLNTDDRHALQATARQLRAALQATPLSAPLATQLTAAAARLPACAIVRPSLVLPETQVAVPGLLGAIACHSTPEAIATAVRGVWAELFAARSLVYWHHANCPLANVGLALLVQPLSPAKAAGTASTAGNPWKLQAVPGLGHSLTRGEADPDRYDIDAHDGTLRHQQRGFKPLRYRPSDREPLYAEPADERDAPALDAAQLAAIVSLLRRLDAERPDGFELEWTSGDSVQIVQFEPALTCDLSSQPIARSVRLQGVAAAPGRASGTAQVIVDGYAASLPDDAIVVAEAIAPEWLPLLKQARGLVVERGGLTSHAAILARELGIAAVVGATGALEYFQDGDRIALDGHRGEVWSGMIGEGERDGSGTGVGSERGELGFAAGTDGEREEGEASAIATERAAAALGISSRSLQFAAAATGRPVRGMQLWASCSQPERLAALAALPVDGIGLVRGERVLAEWVGSEPQSRWLPVRSAEVRDRLAERLLELARGVAPRPVTYRSTDWLPDGQPFAPLSLRRGTAAVRQDPRLFDLEVAALQQARARGGTNLRLLLPFARNVREVEFCRDRVAAAGLDIDLGVMVEVPALMFALPECVRAGVSWVAVGTSDLAQLVLASDREDPVALRLEDRPGFLAALRFLIEQAQAAGLPCLLCGPLAAAPEAIAAAVQWGATGLVVEPDSVAIVHREILRLERQLLLEAARRHDL